MSPEPIRWEYLTVFDCGFRDSRSENELGRLGWELVTAFVSPYKNSDVNHPHSVVYIFKKRI